MGKSRGKVNIMASPTLLHKSNTNFKERDMSDLARASEEKANLARFQAGQQKGHYESYFLRANHPAEPKAFWMRYTVFSPANEPQKALGELWGMWFDGKTGRHIAVKDEFPIDECSFSREKFEVVLPSAKLNAEKLRGKATSGKNTIDWNLAYGNGQKPLFLLPLNLYDKGFPKAKALVAQPFARFKGIITVNGQEQEIHDWVGSQNHNWGTKHTDLYAWGQVAGFDNEPDAFFEIGTARLKFGPIWTPWITVMVLRHQGREYKLNTIWQGLKAKGKFNYFTWNFFSKTKEAAIEGTIEARPGDFVGLNYYNPPGGIKHCLNSKIASCKLTIKAADGHTAFLSTQKRAAFEILTDDRGHGIPIQV
jgi:hypothetical protein